MLAALWGRGGEFTRTPKYGVTAAPGDGDWLQKQYRQSARHQPFVELAFGVYYGVAVIYAVSTGRVATVPFLLLFHAGYLYTALLTLAQPHASSGARWRAAPGERAASPAECGRTVTPAGSARSRSRV